MKVKCCGCGKEYSLGDNIFEYDKDTNCPILICPYCDLKHAINFIPFRKDIKAKKIKKLDLTNTVAILSASRLADASREPLVPNQQDVFDWDKANDIILAIKIYTSKGPLAHAYKLRWRNVTDGGIFADVGAATEISFSAVTDLVDGATLEIGNAICGVQTDYTWQDGLESEEDNILPNAGTYSLADEYYTEFQWALGCSNANNDAEYEFELWDVTEGATVGTCLAEINIAPILEWVCPTGFVDGDWNLEASAYDGNMVTYANYSVPPESWSPYVEYTHAALNCSKVRFYAQWFAADVSDVRVGVFYGGEWHQLYEGTFLANTYEEKEIGSTQVVTAMRFSFYNSNVTTAKPAQLKEIDFYEVPSAGGFKWNTKTILKWCGKIISKWNTK